MVDTDSLLDTLTNSFEAAPISLILVNNNQRILSANKKAVDTFNIDNNFKDLYLNSFLDYQMECMLIDWIREESPSKVPLEIFLPTSTGESRWFLVSVSKMPNNTDLIMLAFTDISFQKKAEGQVSDHESYLRDIIDAQSSIIVVNDGKEMVDTNAAFFENLTQFHSFDHFKSEHKCICELFENIDDDDYIEKNSEDIMEWVEMLKTKPKNHYKVLLNCGGEFKHYMLFHNETSLNNKKHHIIVFTDISELQEYKKNLEYKVSEEISKQRKQEQMLVQQSKMAAMGEMIGAIAHNWRQPLNTVSLIVQDLVAAGEDEDLDQEYLEENVEKVMNQIRFMSDTIDDFRNFFKPSDFSEVFDINESIKHTLSLVTAQFHNNNIRLTKDFTPDLRIFGNKNHFRQALINILLNAKDAILECRQLDAYKCKEGQVIITTKQEAEEFIITVWDNGPEVKEENILRIFEPYFTTKEQGKGTGIGLYMTKTIIEKNMKGSISGKNINDGFEIIIRIPYEECIKR